MGFCQLLYASEIVLSAAIDLVAGFKLDINHGKKDKSAKKIDDKTLLDKRRSQRTQRDGWKGTSGENRRCSEAYSRRNAQLCDYEWHFA
jgi:hypothetical protein